MSICHQIVRNFRNKDQMTRLFLGRVTITVYNTAHRYEWCMDIRTCWRMFISHLSSNLQAQPRVETARRRIVAMPTKETDVKLLVEAKQINCLLVVYKMLPRWSISALSVSKMFTFNSRSRWILTHRFPCISDSVVVLYIDDRSPLLPMITYRIFRGW